MAGRITSTLIALVALAALLAATQVLEAGPGRGGGGARPGKVEGTIVGVGPNSVAIRTLGGRVVVVIVNALTKVERNDVRVPLSRLRVGDRGQALFNPANRLASKVEGTGP